jgi:hypothetical protein
MVRQYQSDSGPRFALARAAVIGVGALAIGAVGWFALPGISSHTLPPGSSTATWVAAQDFPAAIATLQLAPQERQTLQKDLDSGRTTFLRIWCGPPTPESLGATEAFVTDRGSVQYTWLPGPSALYVPISPAAGTLQIRGADVPHGPALQHWQPIGGDPIPFTAATGSTVTMPISR